MFVISSLIANFLPFLYRPRSLNFSISNSLFNFPSSLPSTDYFYKTLKDETTSWEKFPFGKLLHQKLFTFIKNYNGVSLWEGPVKQIASLTVHFVHNISLKIKIEKNIINKIDKPLAFGKFQRSIFIDFFVIKPLKLAAVKYSEVINIHAECK